MRLIKLSKDGCSYYYSSQTMAAKLIKAQQTAVRQAIVLGTKVKGYTACYSDDNVYSNEIDKYSPND